MLQTLSSYLSEYVVNRLVFVGCSLTFSDLLTIITLRSTIVFYILVKLTKMVKNNLANKFSKKVAK